MNIEYTADDLINAIETGNTQVVDLFEKSGFDLSLAGKKSQNASHGSRSYKEPANRSLFTFTE